MKTLLMMITILSFAGGVNNYAAAEETITEKMDATGNDAGRAIKKGYHRTKEALCMKGDKKCKAMKRKHKAQETKDEVVDKADEIIQKVD